MSSPYHVCPTALQHILLDQSDAHAEDGYPAEMPVERNERDEMGLYILSWYNYK